MKIHGKIAMMFVVAIMQAAIFLNPALADRFYVALVLPLSGSTAENGDEIRKGFLLATTQRDAHADEESDGHLGNLDSYVSVIDANGDVAAEINRITSKNQINIIASFASDKTQDLLVKLLAGENIALLQSGPTPFANKNLPAVSAFISAYSLAYGVNPSATAARGYNAAQRIDRAIRAQGGIDDLGLIRQSIRQTAAAFTW
jgi:ABC-type branched-subunit amino acid transport system substrate-binding protein